MATDALPTRARLDAVEAGLDAIEAALARLDAGEVDEPPTEPVDVVDDVAPVDEWVDEIPSDDPAEPDTSW